MNQIEYEFRRSVAALQAGKLKEAEWLLQTVMRTSPKNVAALNLLGVVLGRLGRNTEALASYDRAVALAPHSAEAWYGRAMTLVATGQLQEAIASFDRVLEAKPDFTQVHLLRAKLLTDLSLHEAALQDIDRLLVLMPDLAEAWLGRSNILFGLKRASDALLAAERALELKPDLAEGWHGRGNALNELKQYDEALSAYDKALVLEPQFAGAWHGRGNVLYELRRYHDSLISYDKALALAPNLTEARVGRGNVLIMIKQPQEALAAFDEALTLNPRLAEAWLGRGNAFCELNRYSEAVTAFDEALKLDRNLAEAWFGQGSVFIQLKAFDKAVDAFERALALKPDLKYAKGDHLHAKLQLSDWKNLDVEISKLVAAVKAQKLATAPFQFIALSSSPADQLQCAKQFSADQPSFPSVWRGEFYSHDRISIGYFSADFCSHPVAQLGVGLFERHNKSRFRTTALSFGPDDGSEMRSRIKSASEDFVDVRELSDADVAEVIRRREIDIVVDLTGLTRYNRSSVLARRVAPVQVNFLGYPGTMGADFVDYIIADSTIIPEHHFPFYSEQVVWLPDCYQANDYKQYVSELRPTRLQCGLPDTAFVFCCFNNTYKITPEIFDVWMRVLTAQDNSVLWLIEAGPTAVCNLRREVQRCGISPDRLIFAPKTSLADHLARCSQADLFLDTTPYNAHTTGSDALWAGVPLLTCMGQTFASRVAASLLRAVGLDELITDSLQEYEALALRLASDPTYLRALRERLKRNRTVYPLFDTERFVSHIEAAYTIMWQRCQKGEMPRAFAVGRITDTK